MTTLRPGLLPERALSFALALFLVNALLLGPGWLVEGRLGARWIALEAVFVTGVFALLPHRGWSRRLAAVVATAVVFLGVVALGDAATRLVLGRPLNLYLDLPLLRSVHHLLDGAGGPALALPGAVAMVLVPLGLTFALFRLLAALPGGEGPPSRRAGVVALVAVAGTGLASGRLGGEGGRVAAPGVEVASDQARSLLGVLRERQRFAEESASLPNSYAEVPGLLARLAGTDVLLAFIESYGLSAVEDERYAPAIRPRLEELAERVEAAGLVVATGTLTSPVQGGQSWLAHGSVLSGRWLDSHLRYDLLLATGRETLVDDFRHAGHRSAAVMPAITMPWPEGRRFGYDDIFVYGNMGYAGPALNWVTMPDQYTWAFLQETVRRPGRPVFAVIGLISSHAPWTPILPVLEDWEAIGDGSVFAPWDGAGERPADLWRDADRVREHYARSVDYALSAMIGYAERYVDDRTLLIALGDHQPAPLVTGEGASRAVPVHVITGNAELLEPFLQWGFAPGALPEPSHAPHPMDAFRHWFVGAFSGPGGGARRAR